MKFMKLAKGLFQKISYEMTTSVRSTIYDMGLIISLAWDSFLGKEGILLWMYAELSLFSLTCDYLQHRTEMCKMVGTQYFDINYIFKTCILNILVSSFFTKIFMF